MLYWTDNADWLVHILPLQVYNCHGYQSSLSPDSELVNLIIWLWGKFLGANAPLGPTSSEGLYVCMSVFMSVCLYVCKTLAPLPSKNDKKLQKLQKLQKITKNYKNYKNYKNDKNDKNDKMTIKQRDRETKIQREWPSN